MTDYDAVIIGAGHNGLVCASYLAKAGKQVLVVDGRTSPAVARALANSPGIQCFRLRTMAVPV